MSISVEHDDSKGQDIRSICIAEPPRIVLAIALHESREVQPLAMSWRIQQVGYCCCNHMPSMHFTILECTLVDAKEGHD